MLEITPPEANKLLSLLDKYPIACGFKVIKKKLWNF